MFDKQARRVIEAPTENSKILLKGATGCGKSTILLERYKYMVENLHIPSEKILILLLNRGQSLHWREKTMLEASGSIWRTSYYGFIQGEIKTYYPLLLKNCQGIMNKAIRPVFLTFESAQYLVAKAIEGRREKSGVFAEVTSYTDKIAIDLTSNLVKAATSDIPYEQIGDRLFNALENKESNKKLVFAEADRVIEAYRKKCIELGIFDFGMAVDLYNNCILPDEVYKNQLSKRVEHLLVDNVEECVPTEVDFIETMLPKVKTCLLGYNHEGGYGQAFGSNHLYMKQRLEGLCTVIDLEQSHTCNNTLTEFSEMLFDNIENSNNQKTQGTIKILRIPPVDLRSEMLERISDKVVSLIEVEGYQPSDIVILSTYADPVTEFVIARNLEKQGR